MKFYLITGQTPGVIGRDAYDYIPEQRIQGPGGTVHIIPERPASPAIAPVAPEDIRIEIGETNPFDTSGKPFKITYHPTLGINNLNDWKRLIQMYAQKIVQEFIVTPEGLRQDRNSELIPSFHFIALLNDGFQKSAIQQVPGRGEVIQYYKQKGQVKDEGGKTYSFDEMIQILESK